MKAEVITIGDEILRGEIVDSNKALLSQRLLELDIECHYQSSVRDDPEDMRAAFLLAVSRSDIVLVSGGLGPTRDDITTEVIAQTFYRELALDEASLESLHEFYRRIGREVGEISQSNHKQVYFPTGADVLANPIGTAPGFALDVSPGSAPENQERQETAASAPRSADRQSAESRRGAVLFCMPGVPRELTLMMDAQVLPRLGARLAALGSGSAEAGEAEGGASRGAATIVRARLLRTFGMGESNLETELSDIAQDGDVDLGFRTTFPDNFLRVVARATSTAQADARIVRVVEAIHKRLGTIVYGEGDDSLAAVAGRLLGEGGKTVAVAESCTGGLIAQKLTEVPGSSGYFLGGVVAYANSAKQALLGVPERLLAEHGAVSEPVARAMAEGVRERFGADFGIATTGISGPDGGTPEKPVGLVFIALADADGTHCDHFVFSIDRARHRTLAAQVGLDWLRRAMCGFELTGPSLLRNRGGGPSPGAASS